MSDTPNPKPSPAGEEWFENLTNAILAAPTAEVIRGCLSIAHAWGGIDALKARREMEAALMRPCAVCGRPAGSTDPRALCAGCADRQDDALRDELLDRAQEREAKEWRA